MNDRDANGSAWTLNSLREYLLRVVADLAAKVQQFGEQQDKAVQAALVAQEKAVQAALAAADKAVAKAEEGAQRWQESANEWRGAMSDRERSFLPRPEFAQAVVSLDAAIAEIKERLTRIEGTAFGMASQKAETHGNSALVVTAIGVGVSLVSLAMLAAALIVKG